MLECAAIESAAAESEALTLTDSNQIDKIKGIEISKMSEAFDKRDVVDYNEISENKTDISSETNEIYDKVIHSDDPEFKDIQMEYDVIEQKLKGAPIEGHGGTWDGERGNSMWYPDMDKVPSDAPPHSNPDGLTWREILNKYGIKGIMFINGEADFSDVSKGDVKIDNFSSNRYGKGGNFDQANEMLAKERGCTKDDIEKWMTQNSYTWHECGDCKTMQMVPKEIHSNIPHSGGVSIAKSKEISRYSDNKNMNLQEG